MFAALSCPIGTALSDAIEESDSPTSLFIVVIAAVACCSVGRGHHCLVYAMTYIGGVNCALAVLAASVVFIAASTAFIAAAR